MAIYHCDSSIIKRSSGSCSVASSAYRSGEKIRDERTGITHDYTRKKGIVHTEIITPENSPDWASDRHRLWNAVEAAEKRKDSQLAREIMVALPNELDPEQHLELIRGYIKEQFTALGMIADLAIHAPSKNGDGRNHHCHILLTMRTTTAEGFGNKAREWNAKANLYQWREAWGLHTNLALKKAGLDITIDGRSHANKGSCLEPRLHLGVHATALERKGIKTRLGNANRAIESRNTLRLKLHHELHEINFEIDKLRQEIGVKEKIIEPTYSISDDGKIGQIKSQKANGEEYGLPLTEPENGGQQATGRTGDLSLEERKEALEQAKKAFKVQQAELHGRIENVPDEKTKKRLRLALELENSAFTKTYLTGLAAILEEEDALQQVNEISALKHEAEKAGRKHQKYRDEWNVHAVRDESYIPKDENSQKKVNRIRENEMKKWSKLMDRAEKNGWDSIRVDKERQKLQQEMDRQLEREFPLSLTQSRGRGLGS